MEDGKGQATRHNREGGCGRAGAATRAQAGDRVCMSVSLSVCRHVSVPSCMHACVGMPLRATTTTYYYENLLLLLYCYYDVLLLRSTNTMCSGGLAQSASSTRTYVRTYPCPYGRTALLLNPRALAKPFSLACEATRTITHEGSCRQLVIIPNVCIRTYVRNSCGGGGGDSQGQATMAGLAKDIHSPYNDHVAN